MKDLVFGLAKGKRPSWQQLKYLPKILTKKEKIIFVGCWLLVVGCLLFLAGVFYVKNTEIVPQEGGEWTEGIVGSPQYINPLLALNNDVDMDISRLVFSSLFVYDKNQELLPDLVSSYALSEDKKTYTFYLRSDIFWHDGEKLTSDDVLFTIYAIQDSQNNSPLRQSLAGVEVGKIDDGSFSLTLEEPFAPFLSSLTFGILPAHLWNNVVNFELVEYNLKPVGSGPWQFKELVKERTGNVKSYTLERNKKYYGEKPYLEKITLVFYPDLNTALAKLGQKKVDGLSFLSLTDREIVAKKNKRLKFLSLRLPQYVAVFLNQKRSKPLSEDKVREALVWGVDRERILNEALHNQGDQVYGPILPGFLGYTEEINKYGFDIEKGKQILDEAGWKIPEGEVYRKKNNQLLEFTLALLNEEEFRQTAEILKANWETMGFKVNLEVKELYGLQENIRERNYEAIIFGEIIGQDPDPYPFWHSSQMNYPGLALAVFFHKQTDGLLEEARKTTDDNERAGKYQEFVKVISQENPAIFLFNPWYLYAMNKKLKGAEFQYIILPADRFAGLTNWHIKTQRVWK